MPIIFKNLAPSVKIWGIINNNTNMINNYEDLNKHINNAEPLNFLRVWLLGKSYTLTDTILSSTNAESKTEDTLYIVLDNSKNVRLLSTGNKSIFPVQNLGATYFLKNVVKINKTNHENTLYNLLKIINNGN